MTPELPYEPGGGGGRGREYFLCRRLVELGHEVLNISPVLPTLHNLTWHWYLSRARRAHGAHALLLRGEAARYRRHLLGELPRFAAAACVSTIETAELAGLYAGRIETIPTGVDTQELQP